MPTGWGSGPWGGEPWGSGTPSEVVPDQVNVTEVNIYAVDLLEVVFDDFMKNNDVLRDPGSYTINAVTAGADSVVVKDVRVGDEVGVTKVYLVVTLPTIGAFYTVAVVGGVQSLDGLSLTIISKKIASRRTKVDSILSTRPAMYSVSPAAIYRNILNAIGREDDKIGGSQDEGDDIIR